MLAKKVDVTLKNAVPVWARVADKACVHVLQIVCLPDHAGEVPAVRLHAGLRDLKAIQCLHPMGVITRHTCRQHSGSQQALGFKPCMAMLSEFQFE